MITLPHLRLLARYNATMNARIYAAAGTLPDEELGRDRQAYFGSILGTLNHLAVGDTIWLKRFALRQAGGGALAPLDALAMPGSLGQTLFPRFADLAAHRRWLDGLIGDWAEAMTAEELEQVLRYTNTQGVVFNKPYASVALHFFNHQTHHRGQVTTLLSQAGVEVGVTDLITFIPDVGGV